jgi:outer membrane translocation and assembly module TamA
VDVPALLVEPEVRFAKGELYSPARVRQIEQAVKAMRVFQWVSVKKPDEVKDGVVNLVVRVSEAKPQSIRLGTQLSLETIRWQEQVSADYTHVNLFHSLVRLDMKAVAGYAEMPNP